MSPEEFTDNQLVQFMNACVSGTQNLSQVLTLQRAAQKAARIVAPVTWSEHGAALLEQSQVHDAAHTSSSNPRVRRQVNQTELKLDDDDNHLQANVHEEHAHEAHSHDLDTPLELLVNQNDTSNSNARSNTNRNDQNAPRQKVLLGFSTWRALSKEGQVAWDTVTEDGKKTIISYVAARPNRNSQRSGTPYTP